MRFAPVILGSAILLAVQGLAPSPAMASGGGDVEVTVSVKGGLSLASGTLTVGNREVPLSAGQASYSLKGVEEGNRLVTGDAGAATGERLLGVNGVSVSQGKTARVSLALDAVTDVNAWCGGCHPGPGEPAGIRQKPRDVHRAGDCEDCHTAHRPTEYSKYVVAPFRDSNELCARCHDGGHGGRSPEICLNCHTLSPFEVEEKTSYLSAASRTLPSVKITGGRKVPESLGCTYCHNNPLNRQAMRGVLDHFGTQASKHPVGVSIGDSADTSGEYLSTWNSSTAGELDCIDCHDAGLLVDPDPDNQATAAPYANHVDPAAMEREGNPFMLRDPDRNALCLSCHGSGKESGKASLASKAHGGAAPVEPDGTPLKTTACGDCHDSHYSGKPRLFSDGHEGNRAIVMGDAAACTVVCHDSTSETLGHGRASSAAGTPMGLGCGSCHAVNSEHEGSFPKMLVVQEDGASSSFGTSAVSTCTVCHGAYRPHGGSRLAGCLDCHDEHGEGTEGNVSMIVGKLPRNDDGAEKTVFEKPGTNGYSYFRADGAGICDNAACHGGLKSPGGTPLAPLSVLMTGGRHSGGDQLVGKNCTDCHRHESKEGAWKAPVRK